MDFRDLDEFLDEEAPLVLPIRGRDYSFPGSISAASGIRLQELDAQMDRMRSGEVDPSAMAVSTEEQFALRDELLGEAKQQLLADGVTKKQLDRVVYTLMSFHLYGRAFAVLVWSRKGEAEAPNREARRRKAPAKPSPVRGSRGGSSGQPKSPADPDGPRSSNGGDS